MKNDQFSKDLGQALQKNILAMLQQQLRVAIPLVEPADMAFMLIEVATSVTLTAAATIAAHSRDEERGEQLDRVIAAIGKLAARDRDQTLVEIEKQKAAGQ